MKLVERHIITKNHPFCPEIDHKAFLSKNLFNYANYYYRQYFFQHHQKLNFNQLYHQLSQTDDYKALPTKVSKQIIRRLDSAWISYFAAVKAWKQKREKFLCQPKIPQYKEPNVLPYPNESISKKALKKEICHLSMSKIQISTSQQEIIEARIVPKSSCYLIEIVYEKAAICFKLMNKGRKRALFLTYEIAIFLFKKNYLHNLSN